MRPKVPPPSLPVKTPLSLLANIPPVLQSIPHWVSHVNKKPKVLPGWSRNAKVNQDSTWRPWDSALEFINNNKRPDTSGIGFVLTADLGLVFIDFDNCLEDGKLKPWAEPLVRPFVGRTFVEVSLSGKGLHAIILGDHTTGTHEVGDGKVEVFQTGRYVALTGVLFESSPAVITPMEEELANLLNLAGFFLSPAPALPASTIEREVDIERVRSALDFLDPDLEHDSWVRVGMALKSGLGDVGLELWEEWSAGGNKWKAGECATRWRSFQRIGVSLGTLFHMAKNAGWDKEEPKAVFDVIESSPTVDDVGLGTLEEWADCGFNLVQVGSGKAARTIPAVGEGNAVRFFLNHPYYKGKLRYNERSMAPEFNGIAVTEHDEQHSLRVSRFCGWNPMPSMSRTLTNLVAAARVRSYDPVAEWLDSLRWDQVERLPEFALTLGLEDSPEARRYLRRWMIGAVARAKQPGCHMNNMLVLVGEQGSRKTTFFRKIAVYPEWFSESFADMGTKDGQLAMVGPWIVEVGELSGMVGREREKVKVFISESTSKFRPPYGHAVEAFPRRVVLGGTTNDEEFLRDPTGARRFWIIKTESTINTDILEGKFLEQIWAEAHALYTKGEVWWDSDVEIKALNILSQEYTVKTSFQAAVAELMREEFKEGRAKFEYIGERFRSRFPSFATQAHSNHLSNALRSAGWELKRFTKEKVRVWVDRNFTKSPDFHAEIIQFIKNPESTNPLAAKDEACSTDDQTGV